MARRTPRKRTRPLALADQAAQQRLLDAIRGGTPITQAAAYAGVTDRTLFRTLARGEAADQAVEAGEPIDTGDEICRQLWRTVKEARAQVAVRNVALLQKAATGGFTIEETTRTYTDDDGRRVTETTRRTAPPDWRAAGWLLEHSFQRDFGRGAQQVEVLHGNLEQQLAGEAGGQVAGTPNPSVPAVTDLAAKLQEFAVQAAADEADVVDAELVDDDELDGEVLDVG